VATFALVFAMSGGALAAHHYLITSTKQIKPSVLKSLKGNTGKTGNTGAPGAQGPAGKEGSPGKDATFHTLSWTNLTLENSWKPYGGAFGGTPAFTKDGEGFVHLTGTLNHPTTETFSLVATLPTGFRPPKGTWVAVGNSNGSFNPYPMNLYINEAGQIFVLNGEKANDSFVSLEGVEFYVG
jgi:hypothetical protein